MTKNIIWILGALSMILLGCKSTETTTTAATIPKVETQPKSLLWEISGNGLAESSYLFGTIHIINGDDFFWPEGTLSALDASKQVTFEIDMNEMQDPMKLMPLMQKIMMSGDTSLSDLVTAEEYTMIKGHFEEMGLPFFMFENMKPMFLTIFTSGDIDPAGLQDGSVKSYEFEFSKLANEGGKEIDGLETIEYQIAVFDKIPYQDQADMLVESIKNSGSEDDSFQQLVKLYKQQDIYGLYDMMKQDESIESHEDVLIDQRNKNWIPLMQVQMAKEKTFFAVGAGHLPGDNGVINLLRLQGYQVIPYKG